MMDQTASRIMKGAGTVAMSTASLVQKSPLTEHQETFYHILLLLTPIIIYTTTNSLFQFVFLCFFVVGVCRSALPLSR